MLDIREYVMAGSLEEATSLLEKSPTNRVSGGGCGLRLERRPRGTLVDLSRLGLDRVEAKDGAVSVGSGCTLRTLERSALLRERFGDCFAGCVDPIVGVQFRGCATVGGSIYGRFGFSDLCTLFLALGAEAVLYRGGAVPLETFLKTPRHGERDILLSIRIPDDGRRVAFEAFRRTATDLAVLNTAVCRSSENTWRVAVGARPAVAALALRAGELLSLGDDPAQAARTAAQELRFGDNLRGSGEYRRALCEVLTARCVEQLTSMEPNGWRRTAE